MSCLEASRGNLGTGVVERTQYPSPVEAILERINGQAIERSLIDVARVGGQGIPLTNEQKALYQQSVRFAANRLALSTTDIQARETVIRPYMEEAGMAVVTHPLGLIGLYEGSDPELSSPVVIVSHTDSVPNGDMYDGVLGVVGGIAAVRAMSDLGLRPKRTIIILSLTGEESSRFNFALFGSRSFFHGLTETELSSQRPGDISLREALGPDAEVVKKPLFGPKGIIFPEPCAAIELHVDQTGFLERDGVDLGVVEAIAAAERHVITIGDDTIVEHEVTGGYSEYLQLTVHGRADHSGATPMGDEWRADGLVKTADVLLPMLHLQHEEQDTWLSVGTIIIEDEAMNKIPGETRTYIRISASSQSELSQRRRSLQAHVEERSVSLAAVTKKFGDAPLVLERMQKHKAGIFFSPDKMCPRQSAALEMVQAVNRHATVAHEQQVVGTVGTYAQTADGRIHLGLDVRGIDLQSRDTVMGEIQGAAALFSEGIGINFGDVLSGSGEPVILDKGLVQKASDVIEKHAIGISKKTSSPASHDAQNIARAGIPTVMLFCQSGNGGIAHNPDAYTTPENMEKGVKALAALVWELANEESIWSLR